MKTNFVILLILLGLNLGLSIAAQNWGAASASFYAIWATYHWGRSASKPTA